MIKFIPLTDTLTLRNEVLRDGKLMPEDCIFKGDELPGSFHLGYHYTDKLVCVVTFHPQSRVSGKSDFGSGGYQLRGMATLGTFRGNGFGNQLVNFAIAYLRGIGGNYIWCNARKVAYTFYSNLGFEFISDEFEIPGIGPHKEMYLNLSKNLS